MSDRAGPPQPPQGWYRGLVELVLLLSQEGEWAGTTWAD